MKRALYATFRLVLESIREPSASLILGTITIGQVWSLAFLALAGMGLIWIHANAAVDGKMVRPGTSRVK